MDNLDITTPKQAQTSTAIGFGTPLFTPGSPNPGITNGALLSIGTLPIGKTLART